MPDLLADCTKILGNKVGDITRYFRDAQLGYDAGIPGPERSGMTRMLRGVYAGFSRPDIKALPPVQVMRGKKLRIAGEVIDTTEVPAQQVKTVVNRVVSIHVWRQLGTGQQARWRAVWRDTRFRFRQHRDMITEKGLKLTKTDREMFGNWTRGSLDSPERFFADNYRNFVANPVWFRRWQPEVYDLLSERF